MGREWPFLGLVNSMNSRRKAISASLRIFTKIFHSIKHAFIDFPLLLTIIPAVFCQLLIQIERRPFGHLGIPLWLENGLLFGRHPVKQEILERWPRDGLAIVLRMVGHVWEGGLVLAVEAICTWQFSQSGTHQIVAVLEDQLPARQWSAQPPLVSAVGRVGWHWNGWHMELQHFVASIDHRRDQSMQKDFPKSHDHV